MDIYVYIYIYTLTYIHIYMYFWVDSFPSSCFHLCSGFVHYSFFVPSMLIAQIAIGIWLWYSLCFMPLCFVFNFIRNEYIYIYIYIHFWVHQPFPSSFFFPFPFGFVHYVFFVPSTLIAKRWLAYVFFYYIFNFYANRPHGDWRRVFLLDLFGHSVNHPNGDCWRALFFLFFFRTKANHSMVIGGGAFFAP